MHCGKCRIQCFGTMSQNVSATASSIFNHHLFNTSLPKASQLHGWAVLNHWSVPLKKNVYHQSRAACPPCHQQVGTPIQITSYYRCTTHYQIRCSPALRYDHQCSQFKSRSERFWHSWVFVHFWRRSARLPTCCTFIIHKVLRISGWAGGGNHGSLLCKNQGSITKIMSWFVETQFVALSPRLSVVVIALGVASR